MTEKEIINKIKDRFTEKRWKHILGVRDTAVELASIYGSDKEKASIAALLHDYGKVINKEELMARAKEFAFKLEEIDYLCPDLLHGPVGAKMVAVDLKINDSEILNSISLHTLGGEKMGTLDKIIFLADMVEPNRNYPGVEDLRIQVFKDLDQGLMMGYDRTLKYIVEIGGFIHPQTVKSRNALLKGLHKEGTFM